jgi:23S rRNA (guanosine2251-2'-O)-methyltransferase
MKNKPPFIKQGQVRRAAEKGYNSTEVIYGRNAVFESLHQGTRTFHEILVLQQHYDDLLEASKGVPVRVVQKHELDKIAATNHHQGIAARVSAYRYADLKDLYPLKCVLLLDSVEDPQNLGSIIRTAHALANAGVVIPEHRSAPITPTVVKASSGATERVKIARVKNLRTAAQDLKKNGFWLVGLEADAKGDISNTPVFDKLGLVLGGEDSGIRPVMTSELDLAVKIPMKGDFNSLNVSQAATIALYELVVRGRST